MGAAITLAGVAIAGTLLAIVPGARALTRARERSGADGSLLATWLTPVRLALVGAVVVLLLLIWPISVRQPGDHENMSCGNALRLDLGPAQAYGDEYEGWQRAHRTCTSTRITRVAEAVGVLSLTLLAVTFVAIRSRRRSPIDPVSDHAAAWRPGDGT